MPRRQSTTLTGAATQPLRTLYGTGGVAFTDAADGVTATGLGTLFSASSVNTGWILGAGVEGALAENWTVRVEYLYIATNVKLSGSLPPAAGGTVPETASLHESIIRAGLNFKCP